MGFLSPHSLVLTDNTERCRYGIVVEISIEKTNEMIWHLKMMSSWQMTPTILDKPTIYTCYMGWFEDGFQPEELPEVQ